MKQYLKWTCIISAILMITIIPLLFFVKYDQYEKCILLNYKNQKYVLINDQTYQQVKDLTEIKIKNLDHVFNEKITYWNYDEKTKFWYAKIYLNTDLKQENTSEIFIKKINILGF